MAYRKTENVVAALTAKRLSMITAAAQVVAAGEQLTMEAAAKRAGISTGSVYYYFPDKEELWTACVAHYAKEHASALQDGAEDDTGAYLQSGLLNYYRQWKGPKLVASLVKEAGYRRVVERQIAKLINEVSTLDEGDCSVAAAGVLGALFGIYSQGSGAADRAPQAVRFASRGIQGVPERA